MRLRPAPSQRVQGAKVSSKGLEVVAGQRDRAARRSRIAFPVASAWPSASLMDAFTASFALTKTPSHQ